MNHKINQRLQYFRQIDEEILSTKYKNEESLSNDTLFSLNDNEDMKSSKLNLNKTRNYQNINEIEQLYNTIDNSKNLYNLNSLLIEENEKNIRSSKSPIKRISKVIPEYEQQFSFKPRISQNSTLIAQKLLSENRKKPLFYNKKTVSSSNIDDLAYNQIQSIIENKTLKYFSELNNNSKDKYIEKSNITKRCFDLYNKGKEYERNKSNEIKKSQEKKREEEENHSFKPEINLNSRKLTSFKKQSLDKKLKLYEKNKKEREEKRKILQKHKFHQEFTFKPELNKTTLKEDEFIINKNKENVNKYIKRRQNSISIEKERKNSQELRSNKTLIIPKEKSIIVNLSKNKNIQSINSYADNFLLNKTNKSKSRNKDFSQNKTINTNISDNRLKYKIDQFYTYDLNSINNSYYSNRAISKEIPSPHTSEKKYKYDSKTSLVTQALENLNVTINNYHS